MTSGNINYLSLFNFVPRHAAHRIVNFETAEASYVHPGPSDEQLGAPPAREEALTPPAYLSQEERNLRQAMAESLVSLKSSSTAAAGALGAESSGGSTNPKGADLPGLELDRALPESEFFWVDSHWLRQWVVGEHLPPPSESISTVSGKASPGRGSHPEDPLVLDGGSPKAAYLTQESGVGDAIVEEKEGYEGDKEAVVMGPGGGDARGGGAGGTDRGVGRGVAAEGGDGFRQKGGVSEVGEGGDSATVVAKLRVRTGDDADTSEQVNEKRKREGRAAESVQKLGDAVNDGVGDGDEGSDDDSFATAKGWPKYSPRSTSEAGVEEGETGVAAGLCSEGVFRGSVRHLPLLCEHGGLHPASVSRLKLVTRSVYEGLLSDKGMPPPDHHLAATNYRCEECVKDHIGQK